MSGIGLHLPAVLDDPQNPVKNLPLVLVSSALTDLLRLDLVRLGKFLLQPLHGVRSAGRDVVIAVDQGLDFLLGVKEHTGVSFAPDEAYADEVRAQRFLPPFRCIPGAVQAQLELAEEPGPELGVFLRQLDVHVPVNLGVEVCPPHVVDHDDALGAGLRVRGSVADDNSERL